jgi:hypothetical protein
MTAPLRLFSMVLADGNRRRAEQKYVFSAKECKLREVRWAAKPDGRVDRPIRRAMLTINAAFAALL